MYLVTQLSGFMMMEPCGTPVLVAYDIVQDKLDQGYHLGYSKERSEEIRRTYVNPYATWCPLPRDFDKYPG